MIQTTYKCDLCGTSVSYPDGGKRLHFAANGNLFQLAPLSEKQASEKIICGYCIRQLKELLK